MGIIDSKINLLTKKEMDILEERLNRVICSKSECVRYGTDYLNPDLKKIKENLYKDILVEREIERKRVDEAKKAFYDEMMKFGVHSNGKKYF